MKLLVLATLLVTLYCAVAMSKRRLTKHACPPASEVKLEFRAGRPKMMRGACQKTGNTDNCNRRMSCCENHKGVSLCIRARLFSNKKNSPRTKTKSKPTKPVLIPIEKPLPPPKSGDSQFNDQETPDFSLCPKRNIIEFEEGKAQACPGYDQKHTPCDTQADCPDDRICCSDPCFEGKPGLFLCFPKDSGKPSKVPEDDAEKPKENAEDKPKEKSEPGLLPPPPRMSETGEGMNDAEAAPARACPKPDILCNDDGTQCAVACPGYDKSYTICAKDSECVDGRICCADPCPGSKVTGLCFPSVEVSKNTIIVPESENGTFIAEDEEKTNTTKTEPKVGTSPVEKTTEEKKVLAKAESNTNSDQTTEAEPVKPEDSKEPKEEDKATPKESEKKADILPPPTGLDTEFNDASALLEVNKGKQSNEKFACPKRGDGCSGWAPNPHIPGSGLCKTDAQCAADRKCCDITNCGDGITYCVHKVDVNELPKGCPIPDYFSVSSPPKNLCGKTNKKCPDGLTCCQLDMQGSFGCLNV